MSKQHLNHCRKQMESIMPNYGSDCTCGYEHLLEMVSEHWDRGPEAVTEFLNWNITWSAK